MWMKSTIVLTVLAWGSAIAASPCSITLPSDLTGLAPIILTRPSSNADYKLFKPTGQTTHLPDGAQLQLTCTGRKNVIVPLKTNTVQLKCKSGDFVDAKGKVYNLKSLVCKSIPSSKMQRTSTPCSSDRGYVFEAGFDIKGEFYGPLYDICYDNVTENTFYSHNVINGAAIDYNIAESTRKSFSAEGMKYTTTKTNEFYTQENQKARFQEYFGAGDNHIEGQNYLARGHLAPDADFILGHEQLSTYYYANVGPEFQSVNAGNWLDVEKLARKVSALFGRDIEAYSGYFGQLELADNKGVMVPIYLDDDQKIEVPKYFYKVLLDRKTDAAIVFVSLNNPYATDGKAAELCSSVCDTADLNHSNFPDTTRGYTFCCSLDDFKKHYDGLPSDVVASNLLKRPSA